MHRAGFLALLLAWATAAGAQQPVAVPSLDQRGDSPVVLPGFWFPAAVAGPAPAVVLLHGCGGPYAGTRLARRMRDYAALLNGLGVHALVIDSLTPRHQTELCTQRVGTRAVTQVQRRRDALGALQWLATQPGVDADRLGLLGWSNGGSTVLAATNARHAEVRAARVTASLAVAFYPGCENEWEAGYEASAPLLLLVGEADDWTPAAPCHALATAARGREVQIESYPEAHHGFDGNPPVRHRSDVPGGVNPGQGVHVGGHPAARVAARARLETFLRQRWRLG